MFQFLNFKKYKLSSLYVCIVPNHNVHHLKAPLKVEIFLGTQQFPQQANTGDFLVVFPLLLLVVKGRGCHTLLKP